MTTHHAPRVAGFGSTNSASDDRQGVDAVEDLARRHPSLVVLARAGWVAKGIVYGLIGVLAFKIALDPGSPAKATNSDPTGSEASPSGAISSIARSSLGALALWVIAGGLVLYVLWRI